MSESNIPAAPEVADVTKLSARRIATLDGIRGIAVLMVILYHLNIFVKGSGALDKMVRAPMRIGWAGVDLFFVLSGFLITGILLDTRTSPKYFRSFYARRALRIFPLYYLVLTGILVLAIWLPGMRGVLPSAHDRIFYYLYLNNWWPLLRDSWHPNLIGHFWSLAVEEQFYLLWSACVFLVSPKSIGKVALAGIAAALVIRVVIYLDAGLTRDLVENTFARMDALLTGAYLAWLVRNPEPLRQLSRGIYWIGGVSGCAAVLIFYLTKSETLIDLAGFSLLAFAFGALILFAFQTSSKQGAMQRVFTNRGLTKCGKYSYGMYVYHVPMLLAAEWMIGRYVDFEHKLWLGILFVGVVMGLIFIISKASFDLYESRFLELKKYFRA